MSLRFQHVVDDQGVTLRLYELRLMRKSGPIPWESWGGRIERRLDQFSERSQGKNGRRRKMTGSSCRIARSLNCLMPLR